MSKRLKTSQSDGSSARFADDPCAEAHVAVVQRGILAGGEALVASVDGHLESSSADALHNGCVLARPMPHLERGGRGRMREETNCQKIKKKKNQRGGGGGG